MDSTSPLSADSAPTCLPFAQASPLHISRARVFLRQELASHFPGDTLPERTWVKALDLLQPDLWVAEQQVLLDALDVKRLVQYLAVAPELPTREPPVYGPRTAYLAKRLVNYADEARAALAELEACSSTYGPRVWELVLSLAIGNSVADNVFHATEWTAVRHEERAALTPTNERVPCGKRGENLISLPARRSKLGSPESPT